MARRKKSKKSYRSIGRMRRGGIGAVQTNITDILGLVVGGLGAQFLSKNLLKDFMKDTPIVKELAPAVVGLGLQQFVKQPMVKSVAQGMIVVSGVNAVRSFVPAIGEVIDADIKGIEEDITVGEMPMIEGNELTIGEMTDTLSEDISGSELD
jgi:hypothetical protein